MMTRSSVFMGCGKLHLVMPTSAKEVMRYAPSWQKCYTDLFVCKRCVSTDAQSGRYNIEVGITISYIGTL